MGGEGDRKKRGSGPAEQQCDRVREERAGPAEIPSDVAVAAELRIGLGGECAGEEDSKE